MNNNLREFFKFENNFLKMLKWAKKYCKKCVYLRQNTIIAEV